MANAPSPTSICTSAAIACLYLAQGHFDFGVNELYHLVDAVLTNGDSNHESLFADIPESCLYPAAVKVALEDHPSNRATWHSVKTMSILPNKFSLSTTKVLVFPDVYPLFQTNWSWMDIYQPHGSPPASSSKCAIWGAWDTDQPKWNCILTISNQGMAETYVQILNEVLSSGVSSISSELLSHWLQSLHYLYILGFNNTRLIIRDAMKTLHELKYNHTAYPNTSAAHVCLMYVNHLEYHKKLVSRIRIELGAFPLEWRVGETPNWTEDLKGDCAVLETELSTVQKEAIEIRKMILEQYSLSQSQRTIVLTILAAIFIPMGFVASLFGMNTTEINGSAWPTRYYIIASVPLTIVTLLVPLYAIQTFNFLVRSFQTSARVRRALKWGWILAAFTSSLLGNVLNTTDLSTDLSTDFWLVSVAFTGSAFFICIVKLIVLIVVHNRVHWSPVLFWLVTLMLLLFLGIFVPQPGYLYFDLAPFIIYFCILGYRGFRKWYLCIYE